MSEQEVPENEEGVENAAVEEVEIEVPAEVTRESLEAEIAELKDKVLRAMAETENVRRIAARDKGDAAKYGITNFARDLLGVADNMSMALMSAPSEARSADQNLDNLCVGIEMTEKELISAFDRNGIKQVKAKGELFDHNFHEAVQQVPNPDLTEGTIVQVIRNGFTIQGRLLRASQVLVASGGPKPVKQAADAAPEGDAPTPSAAKGYEGDGGATGSQVDEEL